VVLLHALPLLLLLLLLLLISRTLKLAIECAEEACRSFSLRTDAGDENDMGDDDDDDDDVFFDEEEDVVGDLIFRSTMVDQTDTKATYA